MIKSIAANTADGVGHLACDDTSDYANLSAFAKSNNLKQGTDCICIDNAEVLMMKSSGEFKKIN